MVLMLLGAINFSLYVKTQRGETDSFFRDLEIRTGAIWLIVATITPHGFNVRFGRLL